MFFLTGARFAARGSELVIPFHCRLNHPQVHTEVLPENAAKAPEAASNYQDLVKWPQRCNHVGIYENVLYTAL